MTLNDHTPNPPKITDGEEAAAFTAAAVRKTPLFAPFIYKMHHFTKTGSGQT
jgi:hypothetical protein